MQAGKLDDTARSTVCSGPTKVGTVLTSFVSVVYSFAGQVAVCPATLVCFHGVTAWGLFSSWHGHLSCVRICICLLFNVTSTLWHNGMPCYSHASNIGSNTDNNSRSSNSSLDRKATNSSDKNSNSQQSRVAPVCSWQRSKSAVRISW